jgi:hypothetical protein
LGTGDGRVIIIDLEHFAANPAVTKKNVKDDV